MKRLVLFDYQKLRYRPDFLLARKKWKWFQCLRCVDSILLVSEAKFCLPILVSNYVAVRISKNRIFYFNEMARRDCHAFFGPDNQLFVLLAGVRVRTNHHARDVSVGVENVDVRIRRDSDDNVSHDDDNARKRLLEVGRMLQLCCRGRW